jgi:hypothetical protein
MNLKNNNTTGGVSSPQSSKPPFRMPWWVSILLAIGSYCTLKYLVPELDLDNPAWQKLAQAAPTFAPLATIPFLLLAAKQLYDVDGTDGNNGNNEEDGDDDQPVNDQGENLKK